MILGATLCWDYKDVQDCRYQRYVNPAVYSIGDRYFAVHSSKPKHDVGQEWVEHTDQAFARNGRKIWVCQAQSERNGGGK